MVTRAPYVALRKLPVGWALGVGAAVSLGLWLFFLYQAPALQLSPQMEYLAHYNHAADLFLWMGLLTFAAMLAVGFYKLHAVFPVGFLLVALALFVVLQVTRFYLGIHDPSQPPTWLNTLSKGLIGALAGVTALVLPGYYERLRAVLTRAASHDADESRFSAAMESTLDAILMQEAVRDASGRITDFRFVYLNANAERMLGRTSEYMVGRLMGELYPVVYTNGRFACYRKVVETGESGLLETESTVLFGRPNGPRAIVRTLAVKLNDGVFVTCADVSTERRATEELKRSLAFNKSLIAGASFAILVMDTDGTIRSMNPAASAMLGYQPDELIGQNVTVLHDPMELVAHARLLLEDFGIEAPPDSRALFAKAAHGLAEDSEWTYLRRNGSSLPVQLRINAVEGDHGAKIAYMASSYDLTDRKQTDQYIYHLAHHDSLTGLPGRTLLRERLDAAIEASSRNAMHFAVLMIDLDHFKRINDSLGHTTGDMVLREIANRLRTALRKIDTVARFGGDEFVVLLSGLSSRAEAEKVARKLIDTFAKPILAGGEQIIITASVGLSMYPDSITVDELLKHADIALVHSKGLGRNGLAFFTPDLDDMMLDRLKMESALRGAIERDELFLVYQPQIALADHRLTGAEALIRWRSPEAGIIMPNLFIPIAEETGLIVAIGAWALERACCEIAELQRELGHKISVAVNLSPTQVHERHFQHTIENALALSGLDPECLELEITEGLLMSHSEDALRIIERIQALGVTTAIDDFGTGFSNMSYITRFKVDRLKIDQSFVSRCMKDANSLAVITAIIALAHSLNMKVVAEGVETLEQSAILSGLDCDSAQGFLFSKPLSLQALAQFARSAGLPQENQPDGSVWMYPANSAAGSTPMEG